MRPVLTGNHDSLSWSKKKKKKKKKKRLPLLTPGFGFPIIKCAGCTRVRGCSHALSLTDFVFQTIPQRLGNKWTLNFNW